MTGFSWYDSLRFSIDWVNVTVDCADLSAFVNELCDQCDLDPEGFEPLARGGFHWYANSLSYTLAGRASITLSYCLLDDGTVPIDCSVIQQHGILVSISGDGCRYLDNHCENGLQKFLKVCQAYPHNCTRLDAAMDIFDKDNPIVPLFTEFAPRAYDFTPDGHLMIKGNMRRCDGYVRWMPVYDSDIGDFTSNVYIGDRTSSKGHCCVYNKKVEVKTGRLKNIADVIFNSVGCTDYWYRVEYRAKNFELANTGFEAACDGDPCKVFYYLADEMFTFVDLEDSVHNISRCDENEIWAEFLEWCEQNVPNAHFVQLTQTPYVEMGVTRLVKFMKRNNALVSKIVDMMLRFPDFTDGVIMAGRLRRQSFTKYAQFEDEFIRTETIAM